jgi:hypothetical protein
LPLVVLVSCVVTGHGALTTRSVLVAAAMHATVLLMTVNGPPDRGLAIAGGLTLAGWILIGKLREDFQCDSPTA